jgi:hypothetical protein
MRRYQGDASTGRNLSKAVIRENVPRKVFKDKLKRDDIGAICRILESVLSLDNLGLVNHKLFTQIALNTSDFVAKVNGRRGVGSISAFNKSFADATRTCNKCRKEKPIRSFSQIRLNHAGEWIRKSVCRECEGMRSKLYRDAMSENDKASKNERAKEYYRLNRERILKARQVRYHKDG